MLEVWTLFENKLRPYAFDIFTNFRLIIYMTLKAIVATKIVEYKKRGKSIREIAKEIGLSRGKAERTRYYSCCGVGRAIVKV